MIGLIVTDQGDVFLISMLYGVILSLVYDVVRSFRRTVAHTNFSIAVEDFLYWMFWMCMIISMIYTYNNGELRSYVILGLLLGSGLYFLMLTRLMVFLLTFMMKKIRQIIHIFRMIIQKPLSILTKNK